MNVDFELPPPTISMDEARDRFADFNGMDKMLVIGVKMASRPFTEYKARQVVEHIRLVEERTRP